jgi:GxxExxY protein
LTKAIYKRVLVNKLQNARAEVPLGLSFRDFHKTLQLDLLVSGGAVFEFKAAERVHEKHRAQLMNYLYVLDLPHGKLVNLRSDTVEHEFINATIPRSERVSFNINDAKYVRTPGLAHCLRDVLTEILRDWGTCLDLVLYEEAVVYFSGGANVAVRPVEIQIDGATMGTQRLNLLSEKTSLHITALRAGLDHYENQLRRFLKHVSLETIQWVNVGRRTVTYTTLQG